MTEIAMARNVETAKDKGRWLRVRLGAVRKRPTQLATFLDIKPPRVFEIISGKRNVLDEEIDRLAEFLKLNVGQVRAMMAGADPDTIEQHTSFQTPWAGPDGSSLPVRLMALAEGGRWRMYFERAGIIPRPDFLRFSPKAFATVVQDQNNLPVYNVRDLILVDPQAPLKEGDDVFLCTVADPDASDGAFCLLACLCKINGDTLSVRQYADKKPRKVKKSEYPGVWRVTGRYMQS